MIRRWKAMPICTPRAAARKLSFWQISVPPTLSSLIGRIAPGVGEANATFALPLPWWVKTVVNRLSPVISRLPAPSSAPMNPPPWPPEPSPNMVVISTEASFQTKEPASATALSPGSSSISTNCSSWPLISKSMSSETAVLREWRLQGPWDMGRGLRFESSPFISRHPPAGDDIFFTAQSS